MKRWLEALTCLTLAVALHLAAFAGQPKPGQMAGGSSGDALVSLKAAAPTVAEMVRSWERPPNIQAQPRVETPPAPSVSENVMPDLKIDQAPRTQMSVVLAAPQPEEDVQIDTAPPPPPPEPEIQVRPEVTPKQRPQKAPEQEGRKAKVTSAGVAEQVSAGSGGGSQAGTDKAEVSTGNSGKQAQLQAVWGSKIRARIERNKRYPRGSDNSGDVTIRLTVSREGRLVSYQLAKSSGDAVLDQAALNAVARTKRVPKAPRDLTGANYRFSVLIRMMPRR